jgi:hypothetical protein
MSLTGNGETEKVDRRTDRTIEPHDRYYTADELRDLRRSIAAETYLDIARMLLGVDVDELTVSDLLRMLLERVKE